jgi:hypothetical protein
MLVGCGTGCRGEYTRSVDDDTCMVFVPRHTRAMSDKAKLKAALKGEKENLQKFHGQCEYSKKVAAEKDAKSLEDVAKTVEKDNAILANNDAKWSNLVKRLEEKVAASVPLANAIKTFRPSYLYDEFHAVMYVENTPIKHLGKPVMKAHVVADFEADHEVKGDELTLLYKRVKEEKQNEI